MTKLKVISLKYEENKEFGKNIRFAENSISICKAYCIDLWCTFTFHNEIDVMKRLEVDHVY